MIQLTNIPEWRSGGLWFVIPKELQPLVRSYLSVKLAEVSKDWCVMEYVQQLSAAATLQENTKTIWARGKYGPFVFYAIDNVWRCGDRGGIAHGCLELAKEELLADLNCYAQSLSIQKPSEA